MLVVGCLLLISPGQQAPTFFKTQKALEKAPAKAAALGSFYTILTLPGIISLSLSVQKELV